MITTKKGDKGQTTCGNRRVDKDDLLVEVVGSIDELQSILELVEFEEKIINDLSQIMGELACDIGFKKYNLRIGQMEKQIKEVEKRQPKMEKFLRFKGEKALKLNWARTVCRRVERRIVSLNRITKMNQDVLNYFNRLSDYLFIISRTI